MTNPNERLILVSGATGQQGGAVAHHLLREGVQVRALTRDPDQEAARALADAGAEVVEGSFDDRASLDRALDGAYGAFSVQNFMTAGGPDGEVRQGTAFADAANDAGDELTMTETAEAFSRVLGRDVEHVQVPWDAFEEQSGEEMTVMYRWFEDVGYDADIEALREAHPGLQRLEPFLREHGWDTTPD